jgi:hypothetical protein
MVDEKSQFKITDFFDTKKAMIEPTCEKLFKFKSQGKAFKYIRCDDSGENRGLMNRIQGADWKIPVQFEFTGRYIPPRNHLADVGFATIAGRGRAMMSATKFPKCYCENFWTKAIQTATYLDGLTVVEFEGKKLTCFEDWEGQLPRFVNNLRKRGEIGIVKLHTNKTTKIYHRGKPCMFVGYCLNHTGDTFRMWDPDTKRVHLSRDIIRTGRMYFDCMQKCLKGRVCIQFLKIRTTMKQSMKRKKARMKIMMMLRRKQWTR